AALDTSTDAGDLGHGAVTGSNPSSTAETVTGQLAVAGATSYTAQSQTTAHGLFELLANGSYTYTLTNPVTEASANNGTDTVNGVESFTYTALDALGNTVTGTITINVIDDVPTANNDTWGSTITGATILTGLLGNDVFGADGVDITNSVAGQVTATNGAHGTVTYNDNGTFTYTPTLGYVGTDSFQYTIKDGDGDTSTATVSLNVVTNRPPVVLDSQNWMSSDPAQETATTPSYPNGYPLLVNIPTDPDGNNLHVVATGSIPAGVFYFDGASYVALTAGTVLYDPSLCINLLDDLVYRPTAAQTDTVNTSFSLDVYDGFVHVTQTVGVHEVPPTSLPSDTEQVGNGSSPLTSGNDQTQTLTLSQGTVDGIHNDPHGSTLVVFTDFQQTPFATPI